MKVIIPNNIYSVISSIIITIYSATMNIPFCDLSHWIILFCDMMPFPPFPYCYKLPSDNHLIIRVMFLLHTGIS